MDTLVTAKTEALEAEGAEIVEKEAEGTEGAEEASEAGAPPVPARGGYALSGGSGGVVPPSSTKHGKTWPSSAWFRSCRSPRATWLDNVAPVTPPRGALPPCEISILGRLWRLPI